MRRPQPVPLVRAVVGAADGWGSASSVAAVAAAHVALVVAKRPVAFWSHRGGVPINSGQGET